MKLFDLHCDTLLTLYKKNLPFDNNETQVNARTAALFEDYAQVFAIWSDPALSPDEQWRVYRECVEYKKRLSLPEKAILAVEGGSLLDEKPERLQILKDDGVSILTLVWGGECCVGGAHDTKKGFTPFGREVLKECARLGILADLSHASDRMTDEALETDAPLLFSHSNSRAVRNHTRNLTDKHFLAAVRRGAPVGVSMCADHLGEEPTFETVCRHVLHFLELGGEDILCMGCDLDGIRRGPRELVDQSSLLLLEEALDNAGVGEALRQKIFWDNASAFFRTRQSVL